jgi:putative SOS response-associated peptidase YedK
MCGRFGQFTPAETLADEFGLENPPEFRPRYNIAPGQPAAVVRISGHSDGRELARLQWGLVPSWAKDPNMGARLINARVETAADKPAFRAAFQRRRALAPADVFYEWDRRKRGKKNQPYAYRLTSGRPMALAALWEYWESAEGALETFTILTTSANDLIQSIHDRMPVIVPSEAYDAWLRGDSDPALASDLAEPFPPDQMEGIMVDTYVNDVRHEGPDCLSPPVERQLSLL